MTLAKFWIAFEMISFKKLKTSSQVSSNLEKNVKLNFKIKYISIISFFPLSFQTWTAKKI